MNLSWLIHVCILISTLKTNLIGIRAQLQSYDNNKVYERIPREYTQRLKKRLFDEEDCTDLHDYCEHVKSHDDLSILECVQTLQSNQLEALSDKCQHVIWNHTKNILNDVPVIASKYCSQNQQLLECHKSAEKVMGGYLDCILERLSGLNDNGPCSETIQRLKSVVFSDYRFVDNFLHDCEQEIEKFHCGRLNMKAEKISQGETIACLQDSITYLGSICQRRLLKIAEQQSVNFKLDHQFDLLCKSDSQRLCPSDNPGSSEIFKCLVKHKNNPELTSKCRQQIVRRDKLLGNDYMISRGLVKSCKNDIHIYRCRRGVSEDKVVRLAQILLCLESVIKNGTLIEKECVAEINDHRRMLMMDYQLSPEIISGCSDDIAKFCENLENLSNTAGGEIIHCLMENARPKRRRDRRVSGTCQRAIEHLVKVSDVGEDWRVDPILRRACKPVVDVACHDTDAGNARVMSCLMENIGTRSMTADCEQSLMLIQYFIARDFKLDPQLYRSCKEDAVKYCRAKRTWNDDSMQMDPERGPLILPCLHRIAYSDDNSISLKIECLKEVKRVMRQRAISVDLIPQVEDVCLEDLAALCVNRINRGAEMQCLQDNLEKLTPLCKKEVSSYTEEEAGHIELNSVIMDVCQEAMKDHCEHILRRGDEGNMMECLISHKNDVSLRQDTKCRAAIEHFQIISLKNYHFTYKFKNACRPYVVRFCAGRTTKYDVVACLSEVMRNDTIRAQKHSIPKECRQQVKAQLYQQRESVNFDPQLANACKKEIADLCGNLQGFGQTLECLQIKTKNLGNSCRHAIFHIKKSELSDSSTDYVLVNTCKDMTYKYCKNTELTTILNCLKLYKDEPFFDQRCHLVIVNRLIEQSTDFRFNPSLQLACGNNINQFCSNVVASAQPDLEINGKVINCLKTKFREARLEEVCEQKMIEIIQEQALNYKLNPLLQNFCKSEIQVLCKPSIDVEDHGLIEECLKTAFLNQKIITPACKIEVATVIAETKADINVDPLLHQACTVDLLKYCSNMKSGNGRQLKCLQTVLQDESKALELDCKDKLIRRMEMFRNADTVLAFPPENVQQLMSQVIASPSKKFFLVVLFSFLGMFFIMGMFLGRLTKRSTAIKNK